MSTARKRPIPIPGRPTGRAFAGPSTSTPRIQRARPRIRRTLRRTRPVPPPAPKPPASDPQDFDPESLISDIIREQDSDKSEEKAYLDMVEFLLGTEMKYDIFSRLFPGNTCPNILIMMNSEVETPVVEPSITALQECIHSKEPDGRSVAIYFAIGKHANIIWFDTINKIINRYDPQVPSESHGQEFADSMLREFLGAIFPKYRYIGNTLEEYQCVQNVRSQAKMYSSDYFCQDYSLLYVVNRINGMDHEEAAFDLVARGDKILEDLTELLRALVYRVRFEKGLNIPERFVDWKSTLQK